MPDETKTITLPEPRSPSDVFRSPPKWSDDDEAVGALFRTLIGFVASAKASHSSKNDALDAIQKLQARLLP